MCFVSTDLIFIVTVPDFYLPNIYISFSHAWECLGEAYLSRGSYTAALKSFTKATQVRYGSEPIFQITNPVIVPYYSLLQSIKQ